MLLFNNRIFEFKYGGSLLKNNIKAFILHLIMTSLSFLFIGIFVYTGPVIGQYTTNIVARLFFIVVIITAYIFWGTFLNIEKNAKYDFNIGIITTIIGMCLWIFTFNETGKYLYDMPKEVSEYWLLFNLYYSPCTIIWFLIDIKFSPLVGLLECFLPWFLLISGMKYKRLKNRSA
jgi:cytochrome c oxidase assembly factor CtaG